MNSKLIKVFVAMGALGLSSMAYAQSYPPQAWQTTAPLVDGQINSLAPPGQQPSQTSYVGSIQAMINSLSQYQPIPPFLQCQLVTFSLDSSGGIQIVQPSGGGGNGCSTPGGTSVSSTGTVTGGAPSGGAGATGGTGGVGGAGGTGGTTGPVFQ